MVYAVARRRGEIGIRLALGARRQNILWLVLRETLGLTLAGIAVGIPAALGAARYARSLLFEVSPADPWTLAVTVAALMSVAALAARARASRALLVDPMTALRCD
jgi:ABC-type antimicrobial peptide transport system permease subunit